jgi:transcriptional regulator with GAF, ATPase, and Fis domain
MAGELSAHQVAQIIYNIGDAINEEVGHQEILERTLAALTEQLGYRAASVRLLDLEHQTLNLQAAVGLSADYLNKGPVEVAHSQIDAAVLQGEHISITNIAEDPRWQYIEQAQTEGLRSVLAVPLRIINRYLGVLRVYTEDQHHFSKEEDQLVAALANLVALILRDVRQQNAVQTIAAEANSSLDVRQVLNILLTQVIQHINCKAGIIRLLGPNRNRLHLVAMQGLSEAYMDKGEIVVESSPIDQRVLQGEVVSIYDVAEAGVLQYPEAAAREGIRSVLAVPLAVRGDMIGVFRIYSTQPYRFHQDDADFLKTAANLGAIAIDNARLYQTLSEKYEAARKDWAGWYRFLAFS